MLLQHEADLAEGCLAVGLTALRNATVADKRGFYSGFFNTTIAFERLMKMIVVVDHMLSNDFTAPTKKELKEYGHNLETLYQSSATAVLKYDIENFDLPTNGSIEYKILEMFSEFAMYARYYNLDSLGAGATANTDPLSAWERIVNDVVENDVPQKQLKSRLEKIGHLVELIEDHTFSINSGMGGESLTLLEAFSLPEKQSIAAPHLMVRVFSLLSPVINAVAELGKIGFYTRAPDGTGPHIPLFHETLVYFMADRAQIKKKKRWP